MEFGYSRSKSSIPTLLDYGDRISAASVSGGNTKNLNSPKCEEQPLISIVTVVYNGAATIERAVLSVLNQTYDCIEYVVIDGGSTDGTLDILEKYKESISYYESTPDAGISDAFNKGIAASTGQVIGILNADDWYNEGAVERVVSELKYNKTSVVHGMLRYWCKDGKPGFVYSGRDDKLLYHMTVNHPTMFVPRSVYEDVGIFLLDFKYAMDYEWALRAKMAGVEFCYVEEELANMALSGASDQHWIKAYWEAHRARCINGVSPALSGVVCLYCVAKTAARRGLDSIGASWIVSLYRRYFSIVKKHL